MRQLELFRKDSSVSVLPPPSPPLAFFKRYYDVLLGIGMPMLWMAYLMTNNGPATVRLAVLISFNFVCIVYNLQQRSERRLLRLVDKLVEMHQSTIHILDQTGKLNVTK